MVCKDYCFDVMTLLRQTGKVYQNQNIKSSLQSEFFYFFTYTESNKPGINIFKLHILFLYLISFIPLEIFSKMCHNSTLMG